MLYVGAVALVCLLVCNAALTQAAWTPSRSKPNGILQYFYELRAKTQGKLDDRFGNVLQAAEDASEKFPHFGLFSQELEMSSWLEKRQCVASNDEKAEPIGAHEGALKCPHLWFGWSDDTVAFMQQVSRSGVIANTFPMVVSVNWGGWALSNANELQLMYSTVGCAVNPQPKKAWWWPLPSWPTETLGAKGLGLLSEVYEGRVARLQVEFGDWADTPHRPIGSTVDDATRAKIVSLLLAQQNVKELIISWVPYSEQNAGKNAKTVRAVSDALASGDSGVKYLTIYDLVDAFFPIAIVPYGNTLVSALYLNQKRGVRYPGVRELSATLQISDESPYLHEYFSRLDDLARRMPNLRHLNIAVSSLIWPIGRGINSIVWHRNGATPSFSLTTPSAFVGLVSATQISPANPDAQEDPNAHAMLLSIPWVKDRPVANPDPTTNRRYRTDLELIDRSLLEDVVSLTLFVKQTQLMDDGKQLLGADLARMPVLERLAVDGWWSIEAVNPILLQMVPELPPKLRYLLVRPVVLLPGKRPDETMAMLGGMLINSQVEVFSLTLVLPCAALGEWPAAYDHQLVAALMGMQRLAQLDLTLFTCAARAATDAADALSERVQDSLPNAAVTVTQLTWQESWSDVYCYSNHTFPAVDAFSTELSKNLKLVARCTPPDRRFVMPHDFSDAFTYDYYGV